VVRAERSSFAYARTSAAAERHAQWSVDGSTIELAFTLPAGSYATVLLDEVMKSEPG